MSIIDRSTTQPVEWRDPRKLRLRGVLVVVLSLGAWSYASAKDKPNGGVLAFPSGEEWAVGKGGTPDHLSFDIIRVREGCVGFMPYFHSGTFFEGIKRTETPHGPVFRRGRQVITQFPDQMDLIVEVGVGRCSKNGPPVPSWEGEWPPEWIKSPSAQGSLIRNLKTQPLEITLAEEGTAPEDFVFHTDWQYRFVVETKGVQFSDMMRFVLFRKSGEKLAEFTYRP
jgi:hypothetical protein